MPDAAGAANLTAAGRAAMEAVDTEWIVATLHDLIAIPTVGGREDPGQHAVAEIMHELGLAVDMWDIDLASLSQHPDYSAEVPRASAIGLVGTSAGDGRSLMLNGHIDVVPVGDAARWSTHPWQATHRNGAIYGRGACDMKGGLVSALGAVRAVAAAGIAVAGPVSIASVVGEEDGGLGTLATLLRGHRTDAAVIVEPTDLAILPSQAGSLGFRLTIRGAAAHGALRTEGVSAVAKAQPILEALEQLETRRNAAVDDPLFTGYDVPFALSVGTVRAGEWASTVPDTLVAEGRYGMRPGELESEARAEFEKTVASAAAADEWLAMHPPEIEWWGGRFLPAVTPVDAEVVRELAVAHELATGEAAVVRGAPYGSDLRHLVNLGGIPSVLYGPGDVRHAHREDESVRIADLETAAQALAALIVRWCGIE